MPQMNFTKPAVDKIGPPSKQQGQVQYFEWLKKGLTLVLSVSYGGTKTWRAQFYVGGKPRTRPLGTYPELSIAKARVAAHAFDPDAAVASSEAGTFKQVAENWLREYVDEKKLRSKYEIERHLTAYVYPAWEHKPLFDIRRIDVNQLLDKIKHKHGRNQADAVLRTIRGVMTWYAVQDDKYNSPIVKGMKRDQRSLPEKSRTRILNDDEIRVVWTACSDMPIYGPLVKMLLLTAQRLRKVSEMKWTDLDNGVWIIATDAREKGNAGILKLTDLALNVIKDVPRIKDNPHVFAAGVGNGPFNSFSQRKQELDEMLPKAMPPWVLHDLRRTARSLMSRAGVQRDISERVMGHAIVGVEGVYDQYPYFVEKNDALKRLSGLIEQILNPAPANVVTFDGKAKKKGEPN
jgi:integrase